MKGLLRRPGATRRVVAAPVIPKSYSDYYWASHRVWGGFLIEAVSLRLMAYCITSLHRAAPQLFDVLNNRGWVLPSIIISWEGISIQRQRKSEERRAKSEERR